MIYRIAVLDLPLCMLLKPQRDIVFQQASHTVWLYPRFNNSYRDIQEQMEGPRIILSHETVRFWCCKFAVYFQDVIRKKERKPTDKWHLDEMNIKIKVKYLYYGELLTLRNMN